MELRKVGTMVSTAGRLLATGTMVDLSALEGLVRNICDGVAGMEPDEGRRLVPALEALMDGLDRLAEEIAVQRRRLSPQPAEPPAP